MQVEQVRETCLGNGLLHVKTINEREEEAASERPACGAPLVCSYITTSVANRTTITIKAAITNWMPEVGKTTARNPLK